MACAVSVKLLENITECAICTEDLKDARVLPCIHTFCLKCIDKWSQDKKSTGKVSCPVCRKEFSISGGTAALPKNLFVEKLIEVNKLSASLSKGITVCDVCCDDEPNVGCQIRKNATVYCVECRRNMCDQCCGHHQKFRLPGEHKLVELNSEITVDELLQKFPENMCDKHTDKRLEIYCFNCKAAVCMMCYIKNHHSHKCSDMKEVAEDLRKQISANVHGLTVKITHCQTVLKDIDENEKKFCNTIAETQNLICNRADKLKQLIEDYKKSLVEQLSFAKDKQLKQTACVRDEIERHQALLENFLRYSNEVRQKGTACDIAKLANELNVRSEELQKFNIESDLSVDYKVTKVNFTGVESDDELKRVFGKLAIDVQGYFKISGKVHAVATLPNEDGPVSGIAILHDQMYVSRSGLSKIQVYNPVTLQFQQNLSFSCSDCGRQADRFIGHCGNAVAHPYYGVQQSLGVAQSGQKSQVRCMAACNANSCLYFSDQSKQFIYKCIVGQNNKLSYWQVDGKPEGLSVTSSHNLLVAFRDSYALTEFSTNGKVIRQISLRVANISKPVHSIQLSADQYAVTHHGPTHQFSIVNTNGLFIQSYRGDAGNMSEPRGFVVDERGRVFVADQKNNRVLVISSKTLSAYPLPVDCKLKGPYSTYYNTASKRLYIGEWSGRIICCQL